LEYPESIFVPLGISYQPRNVVGKCNWNRNYFAPEGITHHQVKSCNLLCGCGSGEFQYFTYFTAKYWMFGHYNLYAYNPKLFGQ
jgi:hypothetical protein